VKPIEVRALAERYEKNERGKNVRGGRGRYGQKGVGKKAQFKTSLCSHLEWGNKEEPPDTEGQRANQITRLRKKGMRGNGSLEVRENRRQTKKADRRGGLKKGGKTSERHTFAPVTTLNRFIRVGTPASVLGLGSWFHALWRENRQQKEKEMREIKGKRKGQTNSWKRSKCPTRKEHYSRQLGEKNATRNVLNREDRKRNRTSTFTLWTKKGGDWNSKKKGRGGLEPVVGQK